MTFTSKCLGTAEQSKTISKKITFESFEIFHRIYTFIQNKLTEVSLGRS